MDLEARNGGLRQIQAVQQFAIVSQGCAEA